MLLPIDLPPGQYRNGTEFQSQGRWRDANLVRWHDKVLRPVGGWLAWGDGTISGVARGAHSWRDNSSNFYMATGTHNGLFVFTDQDTVGTLTPASLTAGQVDAAGSYSGAGAYGAGTYGSSFFGSLVLGQNSSEATVWSLGNWGENLIACNAADGKIYEWSPPTAGALSAVTNAPTDCLGIIVTEQRILMALGASGNPRQLAWSDQEDNTVWAASATNQAGDFELQTTGQIMCAQNARGQIIILTDTDAHTATYVGPNDVYSIERVGTACGAISRAGAITVDPGTFWIGDQDFFVFNGQVNQVPCDVADYLFSDMNRNQITKIWATSNSEWSEIWWFYPSADSVEVNRYVAFNYQEGTWMTGDMNRTAGVGRGVFPRPLWIDTGGQAYTHETGRAHGGETPFAETGPIDLGEGDAVFSAVKMYPDEQSQGEVTATFKTRFYPNGTEREYGPYTMSAPTNIRLTGRQMRMRVSANVEEDWRVGVPRIDVRERGRR